MFVTFQMTFAIITPALIVGAFAERMKFGALLAFVALWFTFVYVPLAHMVWGGPGALIWDWGVLDFAGGTVVHINAGIAGLIAALMIGRRHGYPGHGDAAAQRALRAGRRGLLWVGWFGFNAGSALAANGSAGMAMLVTQVATAAAALAWMGIEWAVARQAERARHRDRRDRRPGRDHAGVRHGGPRGRAADRLASRRRAASLRRRAQAPVRLRRLARRVRRPCRRRHRRRLLTGVTAGSLGGSGLPEGVTIAAQVWVQAKSVLFTAAWSGVGTFAILWLLDADIRRARHPEQEVEGLDLALHDERAYNH